MDKPLPLGIKATGINEPDCMSAVIFALNILEDKLPQAQKKLIIGTEVKIVNGVIASGAQTNAAKREIILDADKNALSLKAAEDFLVAAKVLNPDDWSKALKLVKNKPWSCLTYQLIHEFGHIIDGLSPGMPYRRMDINLSPTKYGSINQTESFAEVFTYWVFSLGIDKRAKQILEKLFQD
jgi:hypothetical protein